MHHGSPPHPDEFEFGAGNSVGAVLRGAALRAITWHLHREA